MSITSSTIPARRDIDGMAVIGRTKHSLMGMRYVEGEAIAPVVVPPVVTPVPPVVEVKPPWGDDPTKFDPDKAWKLIQNVKGDLEAEKTKRADEIAAAVKAASEQTQKDTLAQFGRLLSGAEEPETDPVKLAAKVTDLSTQIAEKDTTLTTAQADVKAANLSLAVATIASGQANIKLLLANEEFKTSIASVEPTDEAAIQAKVSAALQANPALKATPPSSGSDGHQGGQLPNLEALLAKAEKDGDVASSIVLKRRIAAAKAT